MLREALGSAGTQVTCRECRAPPGTSPAAATRGSPTDYSTGGRCPARIHPQEVNEIVEYARDRGIRVMPEFDTPGHTKAWGIGYPEIMTECHNPKPGSVAHGGITGLGVINPALNQTYELIGELWTELAEVFPDAYMHLGGDEVDQACWNSNQARVVRLFKPVPRHTTQLLPATSPRLAILTALHPAERFRHGHEYHWKPSDF